MRLFKVFALLTTLAVFAEAQVDVDRRCAGCSRRKNDSLNLQVRNIRVNQAGYFPKDPHKSAIVANASAPTYSVIDRKTRQVVLTGPLKSAGNHTGGAMKIRGAYNSITDLYNLSRAPVTEALSKADLSALTAPGTYVLACGKDTSAEFQVDPTIYNHVFETSLKFFGSNRCGATHSWMHGACHLKDGSGRGAAHAGSLSGGWHDCGDHGKYGETVGYAAVMLAMTYAFFPEKGEDFYGKSYHDTLPFGTDGVPDVLWEAKVGADYILKLYKASVADGLIAKGDMYHSVGMGPGMDHTYWDVPENQDAQAQGKGGPARPVTAGIGSNVAGLFASALAFFAWGWEPFDPAYAKECLAASTAIYDRIVLARRGTKTTNPCCYTGGGPSEDDEALAALGLWFATRDARFGKDLIDNPALGTNGTAVFNDGEFPSGLLAKNPFHHGGWTTDYQNVHALVLYGLAKLIAASPAKAAAYGLPAATADSLKKDATAALRNSIHIGSLGAGKTLLGGSLSVLPPYNGVFTSAKWGYNRYNMGLVTEVFLYWDLTGSRDHFDIGMDNLNYNLGMNPWDISFVMGLGEKNLQHPHNRAANPEGYNAGGFPYQYTAPLGALMGGCHPDTVLIDNWEDYVNTETCIDFSAQLLIPSQILAQDLPPDKEGPKFRNVAIFPEERTALVTWTTDEISRDTVILLDGPGGKVLQRVPAEGLLRNKQVTLAGLTPATTYYVYFKGVDVRGNATEDRNGGDYWPFTTKSASEPAKISGVRVCNETHESALVTWWTPNGEYDSKVDYGKTTALGLTQAPDDLGLPTRFHRVTLRELSPATLYYFQVWSGTTKDDNAGKFHTLRTTEVLVDYTVRIKPTNKAASGQGTHFYIDVANHEQEPYTGLELRFYFTADAASAGNLVAKGFDNQVFDAGGMASQLQIDFGKAMPVAGMADQWYFPITLKSTLPVAGRARFELQINTAANGGNGNAPFALFRNAWSVRSHAAPPDPEAFAGVDLAKGETGVYTGPEMIETVNGEKVLSYAEDPYITAYYKGVHVFGYGPDYKSDPVVVNRVMRLDLTAPVTSPVDRLDHAGEIGSLTLAGKAMVEPEGRVDLVMVNGDALPESQLVRTGTGATFSTSLALKEGTNVFDILAWDTAHCALESRKLIVNWTKEVVPPVKTAKVVEASLLDADADGYADRMVATLDRSQGSPSAAGMAQAGLAKVKSALKPGTPALDGDTLAWPLASNTVVVIDGQDALSIPAPASPVDGMIRPGDFPLRDRVAPVLRQALLLLGLPGSPDTLLAVFSEAVRTEGFGPAPLSALRAADGSRYAFTLGPAAPAVWPGLKPGEVAHRFVVVGYPGGGGAAAIPKAGDGVHIDPAGLVSDGVGNLQAHPENIRVPLQVRVAVVHSVRTPSPDGISRLGTSAQDKPWMVFGGPALGATFGTAPYALPVKAERPEAGRSAGLDFESSVPFDATVRVHNTLGEFIAKVRLTVGAKDLALLEEGAAPGAKRVRLLWNGTAENGQQAGTGAYVYQWTLTVFPAGEKPRVSSGKVRAGVLRSL